MNNFFDNTMFFLDTTGFCPYSTNMATTNKDVLIAVIEDEECNRLLVDALRTELKKAPVEFYKNFVEPRSGKMQEPVGGVVVLTIKEEIESMEKATAPEKPKDAD